MPYWYMRTNKYLFLDTENTQITTNAYCLGVRMHLCVFCVPLHRLESAFSGGKSGTTGGQLTRQLGE